jgi:opacity protein-like surface antigen
MKYFHSVSAVTLTVVLAITFFAGPAAAQTPKAEFSAGYQFTHVPDLNFPAGWYVDIAGNVHPMLAVVFEAAGAYKSESEQVGNTTVDATAKLHTFLGGVRIASRANPAVTPFVQVLAGAANASAGGSSTGGGPTVNVSDSDTQFALQAGGGVNLNVSQRWGVRVGADWRRIFVSDGGENEFRVVAGLVIPF